MDQTSQTTSPDTTRQHRIQVSSPGVRADLAHSASDLPGVAERAQVLELVGVGRTSDRSDPTIGDLARHHADDVAVRVAENSAG